MLLTPGLAASGVVDVGACDVEKKLTMMRWVVVVPRAVGY